MKTIEELKSMTQEDLVRLVQELQDENNDLIEKNNAFLDDYIKKNHRCEILESVVKELTSLL